MSMLEIRFNLYLESELIFTWLIILNVVYRFTLINDLNLVSQICLLFNVSSRKLVDMMFVSR